MYTDDSQRYRATPAKKIIGTLVLILAIIAIMVSGVPVMSRSFVETQLQRFGAYIAQRSERENGVTATFAYDGVGMEGGILNLGTRAVVMNPSLAFQRGTGPGSETIGLATDRVRLIPRNDSGNNVDIEFPDPLRISDNGVHTSTVTFEGMPRYNFMQKTQNKEVEQWHALYLPPKFAIQPETADGKPAEGKTRVMVSYNPNPVINARIVPATDATTSEFHLQNLSIAGEDGKTSVTAGSVDSSTHRNTENGKIAFGVVFSLQDVGVQSKGVLEGPYHFKLDASGTHAIGTAGEPVKEADLAVREITFGSDKFSVNASGTINTRPDDPLPFGQLDVTTKNFAALRDGPMLSPENKALLTDVASKVTGVDAATADELHFTIKRDKQGPLMLGNATLDDVASL
ncbi:MAG: hypothetical protein JO089_08195, partial [Alphaproteobacteria bacterium]|nr:hypothetical protein [Alphaproteobacteria bacterium]